MYIFCTIFVAKIKTCVFCHHAVKKHWVIRHQLRRWWKRQRAGRGKGRFKRLLLLVHGWRISRPGIRSERNDNLLHFKWRHFLFYWLFHFCTCDTTCNPLFFCQLFFRQKEVRHLVKHHSDLVMSGKSWESPDCKTIQFPNPTYVLF